jgi:hypothetical protein
VWSVIGHKLKAYLVFRVARAAGVAQTLARKRSAD